MLRQNQIKTYIRILFIGWSIIMSIYHLNIGVADNGDWGRTILWFADKPHGFSEFWPTDTSNNERRFFNYWLPEWDFNFQFQNTFSSSILIWLPGVLLNYFLYSNQILYIPVVSIIPRFILIYLLIQFLNYLDKNTKYPLLYYFLCGLPFVLMISTTDYLIYVNSFYQEIGTLIFLPFLLIYSLEILSNKDVSKKKLVFLYFLLTLLALAKPNNFYWPIFYTIVLFITRYKIKNILGKYTTFIIITIVFISSFSSVFITRLPSSISYTKYHSIFYGALTFSKNPEIHLRRLGYDRDAQYCIGKSGFYDQACYEKYKDKTSFSQLFSIYTNEPGTFFTSLVFTASNMQNLSLDYLGKYREGDNIQYREIRLNLWSTLKKSIFPKGIFLLVLILFYIFLIGYLIITSSFHKQNSFSISAFLFSTACLLEMGISIIGDGRQELIKHLFAANLCFDLAMISIFGLICELFLTNQRKIVLINNKFVKAIKSQKIINKK
ncbi:MAG: hypothetical protein KatS3mg045_1482 [Bellilinea sp.]|nr:MAG: hypothetical protein KatS3mg045_1482 [Bellilinea sp.]